MLAIKAFLAKNISAWIALLLFLLAAGYYAERSHRISLEASLTTVKAANEQLRIETDVLRKEMASKSMANEAIQEAVDKLNKEFGAVSTKLKQDLYKTMNKTEDMTPGAEIDTVWLSYEIAMGNVQ